MKKAILLVAICLFGPSCYNYYIESRTDDFATLTDLDGSSDVIGSGQFSVFVQEWRKDVCEEYSKAGLPCPLSNKVGKRLRTVGEYFTECPDFVLTCGIPEELKNDKNNKR